jgi:hypothetical protein
MMSAIRLSGCPDIEADAGLLHRLKRRRMIVQIQAATASASAA